MKNIANIITCGRIVLSLVLLFIPQLTIYIICGISDMTDGTVARKTGSDSSFGAKSDSIADVIFVIVCLIKLLPVIEIKRPILICTAVIGIIKLINIISGYVCRGKLVMLHTTANKVTGVMLFTLSLTMPLADINIAAVPACAAALFAAVQEGHFIRTRKE